MNRRTPGSKLLVVTLIVALQVAVSPVLASPASAASLSGRILTSDTHAPLPGVVVRVLDPRTGDLYTSSPTDDKGAFAIETLPPATYSLAVQSGNGLFTAGMPVTLASGQSRDVQVSVYETEAAPSPEEAQSKDQYKTGPWENTLTATLLVIGGAVIVGWAIDAASSDNKKRRSPSQP